MKNLLYLLLIGPVLLSVVSCEEENKVIDPICQKAIYPQNYGKQRIHALLFVDVTDSRIYGEKARAYVSGVLRENLITPNDQLDIFWITANTATDQQVPALSIRLDIRERQPLTVGATIDSIGFTKAYACNLEKFILEKDSVLHAVIKSKYDSRPDGAESFKNSDVAGLFHVVESAFARSAAKNEHRKVYILSDMQQFCSAETGGYFNLRQTRMSQSAPVCAQGDPKSDAQAIRSKISNPEMLAGLKYSYLLGDRTDGTDSNNAVLNFVEQYWPNLFEELGCQRIVR